MKAGDVLAVEIATSALLEALGVDVTGFAVRDTPKRVSRFWREWLDPPAPAMTTFPVDGSDEMVVQTGIPFYSLCEHHVLPFMGTAAVAYIPNGRLLGLSKLARVVQWRAQRLQTQERITKEVADALMEAVAPKGVGVVLRARHLCMEMRGVKAPGAETTTSFVAGVFKEDARTREEFLALAQQRR